MKASDSILIFILFSCYLIVAFWHQDLGEYWFKFAKLWVYDIFDDFNSIIFIQTTLMPITNFGSTKFHMISGVWLS